MKRMFDPYKKFNDSKDSMLFNVKKEINGKKYNFGGEYPFNPNLFYKIKKEMDRNGYHVHCQDRKEFGTTVIWWRKKDENWRR